MIFAGCEFNAQGAGGGTGTVPKIGACCFGDGSCEERSRAGCESDDGFYVGDDTTCDDSPCDDGACCMGGAACTVTSPLVCDDEGGEWQGAGTECGLLTSLCLDVVDDSAQTCACCYSGANDQDCIEIPIFECDSPFLGVGTHCPLSGSCDEIHGACCDSKDGSCVQTIEEDCSLDGQVYQGNGTNCQVDGCVMFGACCDGDQCIAITEEDCLNAGSDFLCVGVDCDDMTCALTGACCNSDQCDTTTEEDCQSVGRDYLGDGVACEANSCVPTGACLFILQLQCVILSQEQCADQGGIYSGNGSDC